ncbi:MAG TPA: ATP-binding protein, partial [Acidimicrobiales bacterium]|nr:ATP-binding protein [Acidimicrobiales bacterium]
MRTDLVGRELELAALTACLEEALEGHPRLALCQGEPGIGKTRLAEELLTLAARRGVPGVWGVAVESAGAPPYWPWRQVLRVVADTVDVSAIADEHRLTGDLAGLAPELFASCKELPDVSASTEDRFRQFDAATVLLRHLTREHPWVIVFDDAHSADSPSLLLLHHVARNLRDERLLVVVNRRHTEQRHGALFAELLREPVTRQIQLQGLGPPAVRRQLAAVVGHDVGEVESTQV